MERSCVAMRLKDRKNPTEVSGFCGAQRRTNFGRLVRVVVDDGDAVTRLDLESPIDSAETFERCGNNLGFDSHIACSRERCSGVEHVVHARHTQLHSLRASADETYGERGTQALE